MSYRTCTNREEKEEEKGESERRRETMCKSEQIARKENGEIAEK